MSGGINTVNLERGRKISPTELAGIVETTTSTSQKNVDQNAMLLYLNLTAGTGTFTLKIQGKVPRTIDTYVDMYDHNGILMSFTTASSAGRFIVGIPDDFKIVATEDVDGATVSVAYELLSV